MSPKIKNILIFVVIGGALFGGYFFFMTGEDAATPSLVQSPILPNTNTPVATDGTPAVGGEFLALLLSVKNIKLNDGIFADKAFQSLTDSSIILIPDGNEGRPNPFAPFYSEDISIVTNTPEENTSSGGTTLISNPLNIQE